MMSVFKSLAPLVNSFAVQLGVSSSVDGSASKEIDTQNNDHVFLNSNNEWMANY